MLVKLTFRGGYAAKVSGMPECTHMLLRLCWQGGAVLASSDSASVSISSCSFENNTASSAQAVWVGHAYSGHLVSRAVPCVQ